jgi:hypothetical protein
MDQDASLLEYPSPEHAHAESCVAFVHVGLVTAAAVLTSVTQTQVGYLSCTIIAMDALRQGFL